MAAALQSLIYVSSATRLLGQDELEQLLAQARKRNQAQDITGLLLFCEGNFMQVIEGPSASVNQVYDHIGRDTRHHNIIKLVSEQVTQRDFAGWDMAYKVATAPEFLALTRADWQSTTATSKGVPVSRGRKMLRSFWTACRRT